MMILLFYYDLFVHGDQLNLFEESFRQILRDYEEGMLPPYLLKNEFQPIGFFHLGSEEEGEGEEEMELLKEYYFIKKVRNEKGLHLSFFTLFRTNHEEEDAYYYPENWLYAISKEFRSLHLKLYSYSVEFSRMQFTKNDDDVVYLYIHNHHIIDSYQITFEDYYLKIHGSQILNEGFIILYPIYLEIIEKNPNYYKNYRKFFYKILADPKLLYAEENGYFDPLVVKKCRPYRPHFRRFHTFVQKHHYIRNMIIDETTRIIGLYRDGPIRTFQAVVRHRLRLRAVLEEMMMMASLPPDYHAKLIFRSGGASYREHLLSFS